MLEKTLENPLACKKIKLVNPKRNQCWIFIGRTNAEAETPILRTLDKKRWLIGKDPDAGQYREKEKKGTTKDKMVGWHHQLIGYEFEQAPGEAWWRTGKPGVLQTWGHKELDTIEKLNSNTLFVSSTSIHTSSLVSCNLFSTVSPKYFFLGLPSCPVFKTLPFQCRGCRFDPWLGN